MAFFHQLREQEQRIRAEAESAGFVKGAIIGGVSVFILMLAIALFALAIIAGHGG